MDIEVQEYDLEELQWMVLMVPVNIPSYKRANRTLDDLLFNISKEDVLH